MDRSSSKRLRSLYRRIAKQRFELDSLTSFLERDPDNSLLIDRVIDCEILLNSLLDQYDNIINESS